MIPVSTAIAVKQYVYALLGTCLDVDQSLASKEPPAVFYNEPTSNEPDDVVLVGGISSQKSPEAMVGGGGFGWQTEKAQLDLTFTSYRGGGEDRMLDVETRALHMLALFDQALRNDPSLGGLVIVGYLAEYESEAGWADDALGVACDVKAKVHFEARL